MLDRVSKQSRRLLLAAAAVCLIAVICATPVLLAQSEQAATQPNSKRDDRAEPPLELLLKMEGQSIPVLLDRPFDVTIAGRTVKMTLTAKPYRVFQTGGVRFSYPRHYAFEVTAGRENSTSWWFSGNDNKIMLAKLDKEVDPATMLDAFVEELPRAQGAAPRLTDASIRLGGRLVRGKQLTIRNPHLTQRHELFAFSHDGATFLLILQHNIGDDGQIADEAVATRQMLEESFGFQE